MWWLEDGFVLVDVYVESTTFCAWTGGRLAWARFGWGFTFGGGSERVVKSPGGPCGAFFTTEGGLGLRDGGRAMFGL